MANVKEVTACVLLKDFDGFLSHIELLENNGRNWDAAESSHTDL